MGGAWFAEASTGKTAREAFDNAVEEAQYEHGHGGYTGTIAEKTRFVMVGTVATLKEAYELADKLCDDDDARVSDKWGPAGCIAVTSFPNTWVFCGWASS